MKRADDYNLSEKECKCIRDYFNFHTLAEGTVFGACYGLAEKEPGTGNWKKCLGRLLDRNLSDGMAKLILVDEKKGLFCLWCPRPPCGGQGVF